MRPHFAKLLKELPVLKALHYYSCLNKSESTQLRYGASEKIIESHVHKNLRKRFGAGTIGERILAKCQKEK